ncbi:hypothetical protein J2X46_001241 [Nocardioides sp. BE266]|uniref:Eco57I restriction-modification methylase domain-containing protein n=1 Tax=Nocardioides sp. BE266 TaxID=2817725 RepID=UPI00285FE9A1|nr:N-6 DNA methylase [Nocardioides sp. BE266]MDR7252265.1 hypothetical protein [Nocardioides sp. BE266]
MSQSSYVGVRIEGGLLPAGLLSRLATSRTPVAGYDSQDYGLAAGESVREAANRVWAYLRTAWVGYRDALERLPESDRGTTLTRDRWLQILLDQLGYGRVAPTPAGGITVDGKSFPVSHLWGPVPIHLLGARIELDRLTAGAAGAARQAPQSLVQELLNRSEEHLWAILSNGSIFRVLRDSTSLVGSAYVEFDLEAIFDGELFSDFLMLFTLCHATRLEVRDPEIGAASCRLEQWRGMAVEDGSRALDQLREGVVQALQGLGTGFLAHPDNGDLRHRVEAGELSLDDYNHALLRVVYRLLFSFVAEDRGALLSPDAAPHARERYAQYFSTDRLRRTARRRRGGRHGDRWQSLLLVWRALGSPEGLPDLGIVGIGGLFEAGDLDFLGDASLSNEALLGAVRALSVIRERGSGQAQVVNYRDLDAEELGSIYEALLEYVPSWDGARRAYTLGTAAGSARKTTGSYYTPTSLIESLLDTALDPVLDAAEKRGAETGDPVAELLAVTVVDPACGSGHFLVGAARRIAKRVAAARTGDPEPPPEQVRAALREVVGRCIYGVDLNPLAAELAKVSLWLDAMEPGKPLTFLDAQVKVGNALVGATPKLLVGGLPQEAFKPIEGDDKKTVASLAKRNKQEAGGQGSLFGAEEPRSSNAELINAAEGLVGAGLSLGDIHVQQQRLKQYADSGAYRAAKLHADAWCAAFVWPRTPTGVACPTTATLQSMAEEPAKWLGPDRSPQAAAIVAEVERLAAEYRFFHWHLEFPHLFPTERPEPKGDVRAHAINDVTGWYGGFDAVLGNPPWERVKLQEQEFFAVRDPQIAQAPNAAARKRLIAKLTDDNPGLHLDFLAAKRRAEGESHVLRNSGRFPLTGRGDINTYAVFAELDRTVLGEDGRLGVILPTGIATDATTQYFFRDLVERGSLASLYDFENRKPLFEGVDSRFKFCLLTLAGRAHREDAARFAFFLHDPVDLAKEDVQFALTPEEITLLNPNTGTCPVFRSRRDAEITLGIHRRVPVLINENDPVNGNPWGIKFMTMFHMSNDSHLFHTRDELEADGWVLAGNVFERGSGDAVERMLPLYEAKMIHHYDTRWATYERDGSTRNVTPEEKRDPKFHVMPRYWVREEEVDAKLNDRWYNDWMLGWRDIARATDERTFIATQLPRLAFNHKILLAMPELGRQELQAAWTSLVFDFAARQKMGGTSMGYFIVNQLPMLSREQVAPFGSWIAERVDQLNSQRLDPAANSQLRAELDGLMFHLYGVGREDVDYILETFPIIKRKDVAAFGEFRTKRLILEAYDRLAAEGTISGDRR